MRLSDLKKLIKTANQLHKVRLFARPSSGGRVLLNVYRNYERTTLGLPALNINSKTTPEELALVKKAIDMQNAMEDGGDPSILNIGRKSLVSEVFAEWIDGYAIKETKGGINLARDKFLETNGDIPVGFVERRHLIKVIDKMKKQRYHTNYVRNIAKRIRAFCNWAEQRGYMNYIDTKKLLPPEQFGEVKVLSEKELKTLAATPCEKHPDVKDLFMLGVYTAQRTGEMKNYTFSTLYNGEIRTRQGKTGKFIKIPLSSSALSIMRGLKARRESEGQDTSEQDKMFSLPSSKQMYTAFRDWLDAAGLGGRITLHNSRSTAISLLINKGVPESITQELANHSDPRITARYYRQIDVAKKREALELISAF